MNDKKIIILVLAVTAALMIGGVYLSTKVKTTAKIRPNQAVTLSADRTSYEFGEVKIDSGKVEASYWIKNNGSETLKIFNVSTSCACTNARFFMDGNASPFFAMHTKSNYVQEIPPGKSAELKVVFDPLFHGPGGVGPIDRKIIMDTNDAQKPKMEFSLSGNVVP